MNQPDQPRLVLRRARDRVALAALMLAGLAATLVLGASGPASAAFPGVNGLIAFHSNRDAGGSGLDVYTVDPQTKALKRLTTAPGPDLNPSLSPDGSKIAFSSDRDGDREIFVMNADGSGQTQLTHNTFADSRPSFSPDGSKIVFVSNRDALNETELYVMNADGSGQARMSNSVGTEFSPSWSPDGSRIVFGSNRDTADPDQSLQSGPNLYAMDPNGQNVVQLTDTDRDFWASYSPDGQTIVYSRDRSANEPNDVDRDIWRMRADGTNEVRVTNTPLRLEDGPSYSPDGTRLVFAAGRFEIKNGQYFGPYESSVWTVDASGGDPLPLTTAPAGDANQTEGTPSWSSAIKSCTGECPPQGGGPGGGSGSGPEKCFGETITIYAKPGVKTVGTNGDDVILGTDGRDKINAKRGSDRVCGRGDRDKIKGAAGNDRLNGQGGKDKVNGNGGRDQVKGGKKTDKLFGKGGKDKIRGSSGRDKIKGGKKNDNINGQRGNDRIWGQGGKDRIVGQRGNDRIWGQGGNDRINGSTGKDRIAGGQGNDRINGGPGRDVCDGGPGHNKMKAC